MHSYLVYLVYSIVVICCHESCSQDVEEIADFYKLRKEDQEKISQKIKAASGKVFLYCYTT